MPTTAAGRPIAPADELLARAAVRALVETAEVTPKPGPGLADARTDLGAVRWAAKAMQPGFEAMAAAARRTGEATAQLREEIGAVGRSTEWTMLRASGGVNTHRGSIWVVGLLLSAAALDPAVAPGDLPKAAKALGALPDRRVPRRASKGSTVSAKYGAAGAKGEARAGFPHVRRALDALRTARRAGTDETPARLDALLTVMSTLPDTGVIYVAGPQGRAHVQQGAQAVLDAGGAATPEGREALRAFDADLRERGLSPRGSVPMLAGALFVGELVRQGRDQWAARPAARAYAS